MTIAIAPRTEFTLVVVYPAAAGASIRYIPLHEDAARLFSLLFFVATRAVWKSNVSGARPKGCCYLASASFSRVLSLIYD